MEEYKKMEIIRELDEMKKKDAELKEREEKIKGREEALSKEVLRLQQQENQEAANLLRRIKTMPSPKKTGSRFSKFLRGENGFIPGIDQGQVTIQPLNTITSSNNNTVTTVKLNPVVNKILVNSHLEDINTSPNLVNGDMIVPPSPKSPRKSPQGSSLPQNPNVFAQLNQKLEDNLQFSLEAGGK
jgi:hypothetical protein